jgi:hypothetical protein
VSCHALLNVLEWPEESTEIGTKSIVVCTACSTDIVMQGWLCAEGSGMLTRLIQ